VARLPKLVRKWADMMSCPLLIAALVVPFAHSSPSHEGAQNKAPHAHSVDLQWKASASKVVGYRVYRSEKAEGRFAKLTSSPVAATRYKDMTVEAGHTYFYQVTAVDSQGHESAFSAPIKAVVPSP
jgi:fibronectin type 3 domain-containing protein